jgi:hypothetical protein
MNIKVREDDLLRLSARIQRQTSFFHFDYHFTRYALRPQMGSGSQTMAQPIGPTSRAANKQEFTR